MYQTIYVPVDNSDHSNRAVATSLAFLAVLAARGGQTFALPHTAYAWAAVAGICIGAAEIGYLYLFSDAGGQPAMAANIAITPISLSGIARRIA